MTGHLVDGLGQFLATTLANGHIITIFCTGSLLAGVYLNVTVTGTSLSRSQAGDGIVREVRGCKGDKAITVGTLHLGQLAFVINEPNVDTVNIFAICQSIGQRNSHFALKVSNRSTIGGHFEVVDHIVTNLCLLRIGQSSAVHIHRSDRDLDLCIFSQASLGSIVHFNGCALVQLQFLNGIQHGLVHSLIVCCADSSLGVAAVITGVGDNASIVDTAIPCVGIVLGNSFGVGIATNLTGVGLLASLTAVCFLGQLNSIVMLIVAVRCCSTINHLFAGGTLVLLNKLAILSTGNIADIRICMCQSTIHGLFLSLTADTGVYIYSILFAGCCSRQHIIELPAVIQCGQSVVTVLTLATAGAALGTFHLMAGTSRQNDSLLVGIFLTIDFHLGFLHHITGSHTGCFYALDFGDSNVALIAAGVGVKITATTLQGNADFITPIPYGCVVTVDLALHGVVLVLKRCIEQIKRISVGDLCITVKVTLLSQRILLIVKSVVQQIECISMG